MKKGTLVKIHKDCKASGGNIKLAIQEGWIGAFIKEKDGKAVIKFPDPQGGMSPIFETCKARDIEVEKKFVMPIFEMYNNVKGE